MKKIFSFVLALVATMALNATTYYFAGNANGWNFRSTAFSGEGNVLTVTIPQLDGAFKVAADGGVDEWHPQFGIDATLETEGVNVGEAAITLKKVTEGGEAEKAIKDIKVLGLGDHEAYKDAVITIDVTNPDAITCALTAGTKISTVDTYQLVGAYNEWSLETAVEFVDVEGVMTAFVEDFNGTFKVIKNRQWGTEWCSNGAGVVMGEEYVPATTGGNIAFANPFAGYKNAKMTMRWEGETMIIKLIEGEFYVTEANWYFPGTVLGWNCDETTMFEPVAGAAKPTFEFLAAEFSKDFKVVYGSWMVEFGANEDGVAYPINEAVTMTYPAASNALIEGEYQDVTVTIVPDYEAATVELTIAADATNLKNLEAAKKANKRIENGRIILYQGDVRFDVLGNVVK